MDFNACNLSYGHMFNALPMLFHTEKEQYELYIQQALYTQVPTLPPFQATHTSSLQKLNPRMAWEHSWSFKVSAFSPRPVM